eukprot:TRINITY_DN12710_c0_g1_i1.p1 TRINITY_DN12710_c0_g1~~TRINITY_DN12710_c0_g1_i1.p1  ORF type:complete len:315 (-),score=17.45 TRINITY_DN12710_c0_g1_i1:95-1039(-)
MRGFVVLLVLSCVFSALCVDLPLYIGQKTDTKIECGKEVSMWNVHNISSVYSRILQSYVGTKTTLPPHQRLTIAIPTIESHTDEARKELSQHYSQCNNVFKIVWLWNSEAPISNFIKQLPSYNVIKSSYVITPQGSLTSRFGLYSEIDTDYIMTLDDDLIVSCRLLEAALKVIIDKPTQYDSFTPRLISCRNESFIYDLGGVERKHRYSIGLTKGAVTHRSVLQRFWSRKDSYPHLFKWVDDHRNCEDILFSFIHWEFTKHPPVIIRWDRHSREIQRVGLQHRTNHLDNRSNCTRMFIDAFGFVPGSTKGQVSV